MGEDRPAAPLAVAVVGGGSWGTALAVHRARLGGDVRLWVRDPGRAAAIAQAGRNERYLPGVVVAPPVRVTGSARHALAGAGIVVVAVPSHGVGEVMGRLAPEVPEGAVVLSATKGLDPVTGLRVSQLLARILPGRPIAALSGPSFAREVAAGLPAALVVASEDEEVARGIQRSLATREFRLYTNRDITGVELAGALKNVMAIAAGIGDSLGLGDNARAALVTRGLVEMTRIGVAAGASARTFAGLAGVGDLVLTCTGVLSRNRALGLALGSGKSLAEAEAASPMVAEGARTAVPALALARRAGVSAPICEAVAAVLSGTVAPAEALATLLSRELRPEEEGSLQRA
ncbi:MAG TPA: NAD(P)H-dependent glycerol-3-phosphate dehydrogenase [Candidatus Binatia bacterium]|nr:NAD(P)H-dependent glycerol-3-phosphate dehydrogenase [Candidatus Binatia bacterium]